MMAHDIRIMNRKQIKKFLNLLKDQYSITNLNLDYVFVLGGDDKIYLIDKKFGELDTNSLRINSVGMYFGKLEEGKIRLSIEGSQIIGPLAKKNVVELSKDEISKWMRGEDLEKELDAKDSVLVKHRGDFYGCGKYSRGRLLNFVPKSRRIKALEKPKGL